MEIFSILAQADNNAPAKTVIKAEDINAAHQHTTTTQTAEPNAVTAPHKPASPWNTFILFGLMLILLYFVVLRAPKKRQQQQEQMVKALKKNDRVQTIGGIFGTVLDVSDTEITLKIDESNNTKIKILPSAVNKVIEQK